MQAREVAQKQQILVINIASVHINYQPRTDAGAADRARSAGQGAPRQAQGQGRIAMGRLVLMWLQELEVSLTERHNRESRSFVDEKQRLAADAAQLAAELQRTFARLTTTSKM